jgi:ATP-binding cassette subfamily F protein 3
VPTIFAELLAKGFGGHTLFDDVTFQVKDGDKVALVGPNGAGKSTLLKILAGREKADYGTYRNENRIHWFDQHPDIPKGAKVRDLLTANKPVPPAMQQEMDELEIRIAEPSLYEQPGYEPVLERYAALEREIKLATAPGAAESKIMGQLGVLDLEQDAASLSGGEKTRVFLARTLQDVRAGDLVVLDEPTNHLDVDSIEWLEDWINQFEGTILMVAHDRAFLDNVANRIFEITNGRVNCYDGNYEEYVEARDEDIERARRDHARAEDKVAGTKATVLQFRKQKRFDGQYASRMKALAKYQAALEKTPDPVLEKMGFGLNFGAVEKNSNEMVRFTGISKGYQKPVLTGLDLELHKGARLGLVGANGAGKSTLLRILTGQEQKDSGEVHIAPGVKGAFFSQEHDDLQATRTLHHEVLDARPLMEERDVKALLGRFRFSPSADLNRTVSTLSGGERQRLMLLKCVLKPSNLLILDEPTNHLDLWARDVVVQALNSYHGTIIVVSHDRFLLDSVTETTAVLDKGVLHHYQGTFTETRDQHRAVAPQQKDTPMYVVLKKFTDWTSNRKFSREDEFNMSNAELAASMTMRNALSQGWIEKL